jgi:predicted nucleic acid-binding protein
MIAYVDSSIILRIVLGQPGRLKQWKSIETSVVSALVEVECLRTLDRLRITENVPDREISIRREAVYRLLDSSEVVEISRPILDRAAQPLPTTLGTLDAIHLSTAILWRDRSEKELTMATHDESLGLAARAVGLAVIGF